MIVQQKYNLDPQILYHYSCNLGNVFVRAYKNISGVCAIWQSKFVRVYMYIYIYICIYIFIYLFYYLYTYA